MSGRNRFARIAAAGITFQAGSAAVDSATIMSALVFQLSGSAVLVGAVPAILRFGWMSPQLFVGFLAQARGASMGYYVFGAFGRAVCMATLAVVLALGAGSAHLIWAVMGLWTAYAFISGVVAVPYNDIVARSVAPNRRSRLLSVRFFGGGLLALAVVAIAERFTSNLMFPLSFAAIIGLASVLMLVSSGVFVSAGEPEAASRSAAKPGFVAYLRDGIRTFRENPVFRRFVFAQWCGGAVLMAMPFYVVQAKAGGFDLQRIALLLGAQTVGALASNLLWGWWGDYRSKGSLLQGIAFGRVFPPLAILLMAGWPPEWALPVYASVFFVLGALANGLTIAVIGYLMEISPDDQRPAYSGYFNAITAPAYLLPVLGGVIVVFAGLPLVFAISMLAAVAQFLIVRKMRLDAVPQ